MIATLRYPEQATTEPPSVGAPGGQVSRRVPDPPVNDLRAHHIEALRQRLRLSDYEVDAGGVAEAIIAQLSAGPARPGPEPA